MENRMKLVFSKGKETYLLLAPQRKQKWGIGKWYIADDTQVFVDEWFAYQIESELKALQILLYPMTMPNWTLLQLYSSM